MICNSNTGYKTARHSTNVIDQVQMRHSVSYGSLLLPGTKHKIILARFHFLCVLNNDFAACSDFTVLKVEYMFSNH